ncbi:MAG: SURF1 family protein [Actinomycetes bacterium]|jgi:surfeit locus 1 family protein
MKRALLSPVAIGLTLLTLFALIGCAKAGIWQYHRGVIRHDANAQVKSNIALTPISETEFGKLTKKPSTLPANQWRSVTVTGSFSPEHELLLRNRYENGKYGFGVITLFTSVSGDIFWVDRGWIQAGKDAKTPPKSEATGITQVTITARLRTNDLNNRIQGSFFAIPNNGKSELQNWDKSQFVNTSNFSLDLLKASDQRLTPKFPNPLPELTDGPHFAYAFQWFLFAALALFGRVLIFREELRANK